MAKRRNDRIHDKTVTEDNEQSRNDPSELNRAVRCKAEQCVNGALKNPLEKETEAQCNRHHKAR